MKPNPQDWEQQLRREYEQEKKFKKFFNWISMIAILGTSVLFLFILFSQGYLANTRLILLMYWGYFTSFSSMILIPYYRIPTLILNLASQDEQLSSISWKILTSNPEYYIQPVFQSYHLELPPKMDFTQEGFQVDKEWILNQFQIRGRFPWKKLGRWYFVFYCVVSVVMWVGWITVV